MTRPPSPPGTPPATDTPLPEAPEPVQPASPELLMIRRLAVGSLLGLIVLGLAWELWLAPLRPGGTWVALKVLPLCLPVAGLLRHRMYTYRWVSLLVWLYFTEGVVRAWSDRPPSSYLALAEIALCLVLFAACAQHVRVRFRAKRLEAQGETGHTP